MRSIAYLGMDVHQDFIEIAGIGENGGDPLFQFRMVNKHEVLRRHMLKLVKRHQLRCCYEASSCGYVIYRWLRKMEIGCIVVAPSLIPRKPGDRIKTDRRDALKLALLYRAGVLTSVRVPDESEEAIRSLVRCRGAISQDVIRARHRVLKFLQRKSLVYQEGRNWTLKHWAYLRSLRFDGPDEIVFYEYTNQLEYNISRLRELDGQIETIAELSPYCQPIRALRCLRGIGTLTAMVLLTEIIDFERFPKPTSLMSYLGLVSSQHSSGNSVRLGAITKTGNCRCRWILVESAWHYRHKPAVGVRLKGAWKNQPAEVVAISWKAQQRLYKKFWGIANRKDRRKAAVAVARELVGFIWAIMRYPQTVSGVER